MAWGPADNGHADGMIVIKGSKKDQVRLSFCNIIYQTFSEKNKLTIELSCHKQFDNIAPVGLFSLFYIFTLLSFYGSSFITDNKGKIVAQMDRTSEGVITAEIDLDNITAKRRAWGLFRDRRPGR